MSAMIELSVCYYMCLHFVSLSLFLSMSLCCIGIDYSDIIISVRGVRVKLRVW